MTDKLIQMFLFVFLFYSVLGILEDLNNNRKKEHEIFRLKKTVLIVLIDLFTIRKKWDSLHKMFL